MKVSVIPLDVLSYRHTLYRLLKRDGGIDTHLCVTAENGLHIALFCGAGVYKVK